MNRFQESVYYRLLADGEFRELTFTSGQRDIAVYCRPIKGRWTSAAELTFDSYIGRLPSVPALERMHDAGIALRWNAKPERIPGLVTSPMCGSYVNTYMVPGEEYVDVIMAALRAWRHGDTADAEAITERRIAMLPTLDDYIRGMDKHIRLPDGTTARVWSKPKRGGYRVVPGLGSGSSVEVAELGDIRGE